MLNTPFGSYQHNWMDNARLMASNARLGGMVFTQFGEYGNGFATIGVLRTFAAIKELLLLVKEVGQLAKGGKAANPILDSIDPLVPCPPPFRSGGCRKVGGHTPEARSTLIVPRWQQEAWERGDLGGKSLRLPTAVPFALSPGGVALDRIHCRRVHLYPASNRFEPMPPRMIGLHRSVRNAITRTHSASRSPTLRKLRLSSLATRWRLGS